LEFDVQLEMLPDSGAVVRVQGDLDLATAPALEESIEAAGAPSVLVLDLSGCTFVDSAALRLITQTARNLEQAGGRLSLVVTDPSIRRVLEITAVDTMLPVHETVDAAL
jgi:anti-sigma B factor antagonist